MKRTPTTVHPGEVLQEIINSYDISQAALAAHIGESASTINKICRGQRRVTPVIAVKLGAAFGQTPQFWLNLQNNFALSKVKAKEVGTIARLQS